MTRHDDPSIQAAYSAWMDALVALADDELGCSDCVAFVRHCSEGERLKGIDDRRHREWAEARQIGTAV